MWSDELLRGSVGGLAMWSDELLRESLRCCFLWSDELVKMGVVKNPIPLQPILFPRLVGLLIALPKKAVSGLVVVAMLFRFCEDPFGRTKFVFVLGKKKMIMNWLKTSGVITLTLSEGCLGDDQKDSYEHDANRQPYLLVRSRIPEGRRYRNGRTNPMRFNIYY